MSKRAIEKAYETYPLDESNRYNHELNAQRVGFQHGYEQAEKETIERAVEYIKSTKIFGRCFPEDFREALEKE